MMVMKNGRLEATREEEAKEDEIEPKHHKDKEILEDDEDANRVLIVH